MTPIETAAAAARPISALGGAFMTSRRTLEHGKTLGLPGWPFYVAGRCGVLGRVDADVVMAAVVFFPADWLREQWEAALAVLDPAEALGHYTDMCHRWGRSRLAEVEGADRMLELGERILAAAEIPGMPLFAGWRALPRPDDTPARLAHVLQVLREHRGGAHSLAVLAEGMAPLEAIVAGPAGEANAQFFNWPAPYPDPEPLRARRSAIEETTDRLAAVAYADLDEAERDELVGLLTATMETTFRR